MIVNKCPECGGEVQATVSLYLSDVGIDRDRLAGPYPVGDRPPWLVEFTVHDDGVGGVDYDRIRLYCENDHDLDHLLVPGGDTCPSCSNPRPGSLGDGTFVAGSVCPSCGHVEVDTVEA